MTDDTQNHDGELEQPFDFFFLRCHLSIDLNKGKKMTPVLFYDKNSSLNSSRLKLPEVNLTKSGKFLHNNSSQPKTRADLHRLKMLVIQFHKPSL